MYLLDTDHMTLIEHGGAEYERIRARLRNVPPDDVATTIISYEEQTRGWLARIAQMSNIERQISVYSELKRQLRNYCDIAIVDFNVQAAAEFKRLRREGLRIGTMDLKIAAIALASNAVVVTRNAIDFAHVTGLKFEDWSV